MKTIFKALIFVFLTAEMLLSCTIENIDNGDLDGFWHFEEMDTLATGGVLDLRDETRFWAFQAKLMHTQGAAQKFFFRFNHDGNTLVLYSPYLDHGHEDRENGGDIPVEDPDVLRPYGIQNLEDTFFIEKLSSSKMILSTSQYRLRFTKF